MRRLAPAFVVALLCAFPASAGAAFPGTPGKIVFESAGDIYTVNRDGTGFKRLTTGAVSHNPKWSPDGTRIAFNRGGQLWVMSAAGLNRRAVTTNGRNFQPDWSPDGTKLVFVHVPAGSGGDIWTAPVAGGAQTRITNVGATGCGNSRPTWAPVGGRIAYERSVRQTNGVCVSGGIAVLRLSDRVITGSFPAFTFRPDFTADGQGVTYTGDDNFGAGENLIWSSLTGTQTASLTELSCSEGDHCFVEGVAGPTSDFPGVPHELDVSSGSFIDANDNDVTFHCVRTVAATTVQFCTHLVPWTLPDRPHEFDWQGRRTA